MGMNTRHPANSAYEFIRYKAPHSAPTPDMFANAEVIGRFLSSHSDRGLSYFHSFALTQTYIVFFEYALKFDLKRFAKNSILYGKPFSDALVMNKDFKTRIHIMNKKTGEVVKQKFVTDPLFVFHHINAYEKQNEGELVVDVCAYDPRHFDMNSLSREAVFTEKLDGAETTRSTAKRVTVPVKNSSDKPIHCEIKDINTKFAVELPTTNYARYNAKSYKYAYGVNLYKSPYSIVKLNVDDQKEAVEVTFGQKGREFLPTEPIFVADPNGKDEDDGVLLVMVLAESGDFLSVLNAKDMSEIARAQVPADVKGAFTFHGFFASQKTFPKLNL